MAESNLKNITPPLSSTPFWIPLLTFVLFIFLLCTVAYATFEQFKNAITEKEIQDLGAIADLKVAQIVDWRESHKRRAEHFLHGTIFPDEVAQWLRGGAPADERKQKILNSLLSMQQEHGYKSISLLDMDGVTRISTNDNHVPDLADKKLAIEAMRSRRGLFSDFHRKSREHSQIAIHSVAPLLASDVKKDAYIVGALLFEIDPASFLYPLIQSWPTQSQSAETLLVRRDGDDVLFLNDVRNKKGSALSLRIPLSNTQLPAALAIQGQTKVTQGIDYRGIPVVAALRSIPDTPWFMVSKIDKAEFLAPINTLQQWVTGIVFVFAALGGALIFFWSKRQQARYAHLKALHDAAVEREILVKRFEYLTMYANDIIFLMDDDLHILEANDRALGTYGYSREEFLTMTARDLLPADRVPIFEKSWRYIKEHDHLVNESLHRRKDGTTFPVEVSTRRIEKEGRVLVQPIVRDITERKQAESALRKSETLLKKSQRMAHIGSWELDLANNSLVWSDEMYCIFEIDPAQFGATYEDFLHAIHSDDRAMVDKAYTDSLKNNTPYEIVHRLLFPDQRIKFVQEWCKTEYDDEGRPIRSIGTAQDITKSKQTEAALIESKEQAEEATRTKSKFLARMSHELRTPLNAILGFAQVMEVATDDETLGTHREELNTIIRSGWHLLRLIDDLLNLSAIEANKVTLHYENIDIHNCLPACFELLTPLARERGIVLSCMDDACDGLFVRADAFRLNQVLINLLANAIKYNRDGGSVTVSCRRTAGRIRILVSDTGEGIPESELSSLFQPFSRLTQRPYSVQGAGIGLSIAKQLTELMGGTIGVESVFGKGSTFWIELPEVEEPEEVLAVSKTPPSPNAATPGNQATLLYIEDNPDHAKLVKEIVARMDRLSLLVAHTPSIGLDLARARRPDLILLDICLPGMNGYEVLKLLKTDARTCNIPVIAISASTNPAEIEKGLQAGFRRYLSKPLNVINFKTIIVELLRDAVKRLD